MRDLDFTGRIVCVVGGSSGIGNAIARGFQARGATVHVTGTRELAVDYTAIDDSDLTGLTYAKLDLAERDAIDSFQASFERLDVLVLSQGTIIYGRGEFARQGWDRVMAVNLDGVMACAQRFHDMLAASTGALVMIGSVTGIITSRANPAYAASKAAVHHLAANLAEAWAADGIRVNAVAPGLVRTKMTAVTMDHPRRAADAVRGIPLGRVAAASEIANVVLFLASPLASYVIGQTVIVDGGMTLSR